MLESVFAMCGEFPQFFGVYDLALRIQNHQTGGETEESERASTRSDNKQWLPDTHIPKNDCYAVSYLVFGRKLSTDSTYTYAHTHKNKEITFLSHNIVSIYGLSLCSRSGDAHQE